MDRRPLLVFAVVLVAPCAAWPQGHPLGPEFRVNTYTTGNQGRPLFSSEHPSVRSDSSGNFVVAWTSAQDAFYGVFGQRYDASGIPLGPEFRVNTTAPGYQLGPAVASDASGNFVVVWFSNDPFTQGIPEDAWGQRYASTGAPLGTEFRVNTTTLPEPNRTSVAMDSAGDFVVVWESAHDGSSSGVFGQRFANTGAPLGPEFRVNTYTTDTQYLAGVASDAAGKFVVVWCSVGQDGSDRGVFGQRYSMIVPVELMGFGVE